MHNLPIHRPSPAPSRPVARRPAAGLLPAWLSLDDPGAYRRWRAGKLAAWPPDAESLWVSVTDPVALGDDERRQLAERCAAFNLAFYTTGSGRGVSRTEVLALGQALGLTNLERAPQGAEDGVAAIQVAAGGPAGEYIPFTARPLNWHTDGYYNPLDRPIRGVLMHCVRRAQKGGASRFLDHEIAYILLRDENPAYVEALMADDAMTIPENPDPQRVPRPERRGPVFSVDPRSGRLHMRYTARRRSIVWKPGAAAEAAECLLELLEGASPFVVEVQFEAGQGVVCNNVLHARTAFDDAGGDGRLLWRARYHDRVAPPT